MTTDFPSLDDEDACAKDSAATAANAAVSLQLAEEAPSKQTAEHERPASGIVLAFLRQQDGMTPPTERCDESLVATFVDAARRIAADKNIASTPEQLAMVARIVADGDPDMVRGLRSGDARAIQRTAAVLDYVLDLSMATQVLAVLRSLAGHDVSDMHALVRHAEKWLRPAANDQSIKRLRWPDPDEAVESYNKARASGPVRVTLQTKVSANYLLDRAVCLRKPMSEAGLLPRPWRAPVDEGLPKAALRAVPFGPVVRSFPDGAVCTTYWRLGELHRDPKEGPARHFKRGSEERIEYAVDGDPHRDAADGPALIYSHFDGKEIAGEEYFDEGQCHRPSADGPAILQIDRSSTRLREIFIENDVWHRDPKEGPAFYLFEDGVEKLEYMVHGRQHRDECDGPAVIHRHLATGTSLLEVYYRDGKLHRSSGPAMIGRSEDGAVVFADRFEDDVWQSDEASAPVGAPHPVKSRKERRAARSRKRPGRKGRRG